MFKISQLIENVRMFGNCSLYILDDSINCIENQFFTNTVLEFTVDENNELIVTHIQLVSKNKPYYNGQYFNNDVEIIDEIEINKFKGSDIARCIAILLSLSINNRVGLKTKNVKNERNTDIAVSEIYCLASKMLANWSNKDFTDWIKTSYYSKVEMFLEKAKQDFSEEMPFIEVASSFMEGKMAKFYTQLRKVKNIFEKLGSSKNEGYTQACYEWSVLCEDTEIPVPTSQTR